MSHAIHPLVKMYKDIPMKVDLTTCYIVHLNERLTMDQSHVARNARLATRMRRLDCLRRIKGDSLRSRTG